MKTHLLAPFEAIPYFTIEGFRQYAGMEKPEQARALLYRWAKAGKILPLKKGAYMTRTFYERRAGKAFFMEAVSAVILPHSYLSLEYVLQQRNILTEATYPVTCVTPKNTRKIVNALGTFWYRNIRADLYCGFAPREYQGVRFFAASAAKALFDYLYLRPLQPALRKTADLAEELRLNLDEFSKEEREEFAAYVRQSASRKMAEALENFERTIWKA